MPRSSVTTSHCRGGAFFLIIVKWLSHSSRYFLACDGISCISFIQINNLIEILIIMQVNVIACYQRLGSTQYTLGYFCCPDMLAGMKYWPATCLLIQGRCKM
ncbi:hypothetical protein AAZV13_19G073400 [Glycine max]